MGQVVPVVFGRHRPRLIGLEEHLPNVFVCGAEDLQEGLVLGRFILTSGKSGAGTEGSRK